MSGNTLRVGDVAAATGVSPRLLRYYEERGLLEPSRSATGQRLYERSDIERVERIRRLLDAGLSTEVIAQILACACGGAGDVEPCLDPVLREELERVDARMAQLVDSRKRLSALVATGRAVGERPAERRPELLLKPRGEGR